MRKLVESTFTTLDGVISDPQNWGPPYWDDEHAGYAEQLVHASDTFLLGRETYEGFAAAWPSRAGDEFADRMNATPKIVASTTLPPGPADWNATVVRDVAAEVARLKDQPGANILKFGTGELDRTLLEDGLLDELHLWVFPVAVGGGDRVFDRLGAAEFDLVDTTRFRSGIVVLTYAPK
jgi:dihydrofolate reductase